MKRDLILGVIIAILVHGGFALSGYLMSTDEATAPAPEPTPVIEVMALPPVEPDPVEIVESSSEAPSNIADIAPPSLNDTPSATIDSSFVQQIQPPAPPRLTRPTGAITIPLGRPAGGAAGTGIGNVFDFASLDQNPVARFQPRPVYPSEMRRAGANGEVIVAFIVDAQGNVSDAQSVRSTQRDFESAAIEAVMKYKFRPGQKGGVAVNTRMEVSIRFTLTAD